MRSEDNGRILICDDEQHLREMVCEYLLERGFDVLGVGLVSELREVMDTSQFDLIILDLKMPGEDGLSALRWIRENFHVPVIMLTAVSEVVDRIVGLELGADDYIAKPVNLRELEARIKSTLRLAAVVPETGSEPENKAGTELITIGCCQFDVKAAKLYGKDADEIPITSMEYELLKLFVENSGQVLDRDALLANSYDREWHPFDRSIDLRISRLRRKVEFNPKKPQVIRTVRGIGYIFDNSSID